MGRLKLRVRKDRVLFPLGFFNSGEKWLFCRQVIDEEMVYRLVKTDSGFKLYSQCSNEWVAMRVNPMSWGFRDGMEIPLEPQGRDWIVWLSQAKDYRGKGEANRFTVSVSQQEKLGYEALAKKLNWSVSRLVREALQFYVEENRLMDSPRSGDFTSKYLDNIVVKLPPAGQQSSLLGVID